MELPRLQDTIMCFGRGAVSLATKIFNSDKMLKSTTVGGGGALQSLSIRRQSPQMARVVRDVLMLMQKSLELIEQVDGKWIVTAAVGH